MRNLVTWLKSVDLVLNLVAAVLGLYLAASSAFKGAKWPSEQFWNPWSGWFVAMLVAGIYVPLFAFYKYASERYAVAEIDLAFSCQQIALKLLRHSPGLDVDHVAVQVWLCEEAKGTFVRHSRFFLAEYRDVSGVDWRKGVGVVGTTWERGINSAAVDLRLLQDQRQALGQATFDALNSDQRLGMSWIDFENTKRYTWVWATRLLSEKDSTKLLGMLVVDYTGANVGKIDAVVQEQKFLDDVGPVVGALARQLDGSPLKA